MERILFYEVEYYFLSNFSAFAVEWMGRLWMTAEHAYQAAKFLEEEIRELIRNARSAHEAKQIAKKYKHLRRDDWDEIKLSVMESILRAKLEQHPEILKKLLLSEGKFLVEDSPTDSFWGRGHDWKGENWLGRIWMKLRDEFFPKRTALASA